MTGSAVHSGAQRRRLSGMRARCIRSLAAGVALLCAGCASDGAGDVSGLAERPPLPASVLVSGGSFVRGVVGSGPLATEEPEQDGPRQTTFALDETDAEAISLNGIASALRGGRVFVRLEVDADASAAERAELAGMRGNLPLGTEPVEQLLARARAAGHDYVLIVQQLQDGPVEAYGINDRWPLTLATWLLVGLGMLVPDHTFESRAALQASLFEVYSGREVHRAVGSAGPTDLSLLSRSDLWGLIQQVLIPPFWVGSDDEEVVRQVRLALEQRLPVELARRLKSAACQQDLAARARAICAAERVGRRALRITVRSTDGLSLCALRIDGTELAPASARNFQRSLLASVRSEGDVLVYAADLPDAPAGRYVQILVQSVRGDAASATIDLGAK